MTEVDPVGGKSLAHIEVGKEGKLEFPLPTEPDVSSSISRSRASSV